MRDIFEEALERLDLESVCMDHDTEFNRNGKASCPYPDHEDNDPSFSLHPSKTYAYCFGCGRGGNAIQLEYDLGKYPSKFEALKSLNDRYSLNLKFNGYDREKAREHDYAHQLIDWYCEQTNKMLVQDKEALKWLESKKGITLEIVKEYNIGYLGNGLLKDRAKDKSKEIALRLGLLKEKDGKVYDTFWNRIIFPVWNYGRIVSIWAREWPDGEAPINKWLGLASSEFVPNKSIAFVENLNCKKCILAESIPDALAFIQAGIPAAALLGKDISQANKRYLERAKAKLCFALDPDKEGREASYKLAREYHGYIVDLGHDKDPDEILAGLGLYQFKLLAEKGINEATYYLDAVIENEDKIDVLREIAKLEFESDKAIWIKRLADKYDITKKSLRDDLKAISNEAQAVKESQESSNPLSEYTEDEIEKARELLRDPNLLNRIIEQIGKNDYIGELVNKTVLVLSFTSRLFDEAISNVVKGESSSGKSALVKAVLKVFPKCVYKEFTRITAQSLYYLKDLDLSHKILVIFESHGSEEANYSLRSIISEGQLRLLVTGKNEKTGLFESKEIVIPAEGLSYIETTTKSKLDPENQTRLFDLYIDNSQGQTKEILKSKSKHFNKELIEKENRVYQALQLLLKPFDVDVPYLEILANTFPVDKVRSRRDFPRFVNLIKANCLLHQEQRQKTEIEGKTCLIATSEDYKTAYDLASVVLSQTLKEITPPQEEILTIIKEQHPDDELSMSELAKLCDRKLNTTFRTDIYALASSGYLEYNGEKGKKSKYQFVSLPQEMLKLPSPETLKKLFAETSDSLTQSYKSESLQGVEPENRVMTQSGLNDSINRNESNESTISHDSIIERNHLKSLDSEPLSQLVRENEKKIFSEGDEIGKRKTGLCTGCWKIRIACICN